MNEMFDSISWYGGERSLINFMCDIVVALNVFQNSNAFWNTGEDLFVSVDKLHFFISRRFLSFNLMCRLSGYIYEFGCHDKVIRKNYVEELIMDLFNRIVSNLEKLPNKNSEISHLDIMDNCLS